MNTEDLETKLQQSEQREANLKEQLVDLKKELEDMSYAISHDLRAPLRAVHGFADALREDYGEKLDADAKRYMKIISTSSRQMTRMIDGILTLSRLGRQQLQVSAIPVPALVEGIIAELKAKYPERKIDFVIGELPNISGDHALIRVIWSHLLNNAVKFTGPNPGTIIEIGSSSEGNETIYFVRDNGVGFDMKYEPKLFGLFQRFHTEAEFEGTGVGLAVVRRLVRRHGGRMWAQSAVNVGSTFFFAFPKQAVSS